MQRQLAPSSSAHLRWSARFAARRCFPRHRPGLSRSHSRSAVGAGDGFAVGHISGGTFQSGGDLRAGRGGPLRGREGAPLHRRAGARRRRGRRPSSTSSCSRARRPANGMTSLAISNLYGGDGHFSLASVALTEVVHHGAVPGGDRRCDLEERAGRIRADRDRPGAHAVSISSRFRCRTPRSIRRARPRPRSSAARRRSRSLWLFWVAPIVGGVIGGVICRTGCRTRCRRGIGAATKRAAARPPLSFCLPASATERILRAAASACAGAAAFCLASRSSPVAWSTTFIDRRTLPRSSMPSSLTLTLSPSLTTSVTLLTRLRRELADVHEAVLGAEEVHEGAEVHHLDHGAFVDLADLRIGRDRLDPVDRRLDRTRRRRRRPSPSRRPRC